MRVGLDGLGSYSLFAALLAAAGLPIYIHAPKFYVDEYGVSLTALGAALFALRLVDVVQDPILGWLSGRLSGRRGIAVVVAGAIMALAMIGLFAITPPISPLIWFTFTLGLLFSSFSFLTISFYAQGVAKARQLGRDGHVRLAAWRETGSLLGVSLAAIAPFALVWAEAPFAMFSILFAIIACFAIWTMRNEWQAARLASITGFAPILSDPLARRLLLIALLNATPVAVTSTLFLFFVESRLAAPGWEGPLLLLFFFAAALSATAWGRIARGIGAKRALMWGMVLAIASFGCAAFLGAGDTLAFALICVASGAALGADMTLLPAIFAARLAEISPAAAEGFGLWSFVTKFTLAFAAIVLLPILEASGFAPGSNDIPASALQSLTLMYAVLPCALKLLALALLASTNFTRSVGTAAIKRV